MQTQPVVHPLPTLPALRRRRRLRVVDARFQWKVTFVVTGMVVGLGAALAAMLYRSQRANTRLLELGPQPQLLDEVARGDQLLLLALLAALAVAGILLALGGLLWTQRISGPVRVFKRYLAGMAQGAVPELRPLRKRDELRDLSDAFDAAITGLRRRQALQIEQLDAALAAAGERVGAADFTGGVEVAVAALEQQRDALASSLNGRVATSGRGG